MDMVTVRGLKPNRIAGISLDVEMTRKMPRHIAEQFVALGAGEIVRDHTTNIIPNPARSEIPSGARVLYKHREE